MNKLYVGNLRWTITDADLSNIFQSAGKVISSTIILDRETGRSRGFGFIEMSSEEEAKIAIQSLNGKSIEGRTLVVKEALPEGVNQDNKIGMEVATLIRDFIATAEVGKECSFQISDKKFVIIRDS